MWKLPLEVSRRQTEWVMLVLRVSFSAVTLLVCWKKGQLACKATHSSHPNSTWISSSEDWGKDWKESKTYTLTGYSVWLWIVSGLRIISWRQWISSSLLGSYRCCCGFRFRCVKSWRSCTYSCTIQCSYHQLYTGKLQGGPLSFHHHFSVR